MKDCITLCDLEVFYRVGVPDEERFTPQRLLLNVEMDHDFAAAAAADDLTRTINYYDVSRKLLAYGTGKEWKLIETLAVDIARWILKEYPVSGVTVEVKKFILPETRHVSVRHRAERASGASHV